MNINPLLTSNAPGTFSLTSEGYVQGISMDSPNARYNLASGQLLASQTLPMWGGLPIQERVPTDDSPLQGQLLRATALANITGFSVYDQGHNAINSPQSPAPVFTQGMTLNFYRLGSGARIPVKCDPALVSLEGGLITQQVSWDYTNGQLIAYDSTNALPVKVLGVNVGNSKIVVYDAGTGFSTWNNSGTAALILI